MALEDILKARQEKKERIIKAGENPYPASLPEKVSSIGAVTEDFKTLERKAKPIAIAGRLMGLRFHGGVVFGDLKDFSGKLQVLFRKDTLGDRFQFVETLDIGDFLFAKGKPFVTKAGEATIEVSEAVILAKSTRPIPTDWFGLENPEERYRKRYLDLLVNEDVFRRFVARSRIIAGVRAFLNGHGFEEVETPVLQTLYGGATAKPFKTQLDTLKLDLFLRIAPELYLKRLLVGGFEKIYEIGRVFRNEGMDREHNPEFTMLELYWAYQDREGLMNFVEELVENALKLSPYQRDGTLFYQGKEISMKRPWKRISFSGLLGQTVGMGWEASEQTLRKAGEAKGLEFDRGLTKGKIADEIIKKLALPNLVEPTFLIDHPTEISPLAKANPEKPDETLRFQPIMAGWEFGNGFAELNDPVDQRVRFESQEKLRKAGDTEAHHIDEDFVEALEYAMPPAAGLGIGIDRLVALLTDAPSLKEVIFFPLMKPKS